jgi:hypothetical protein
MNKYFLWVIFVFFLALTSCNSDVNIDDDVETPDVPVLSATNNLLTRSVTAVNGFHMACFQIGYPFALIDVDNKKYSVTSDADFNALVADSSIQIIVDFVYPIKVINEDDATEVIINNGLELFNVFASCIPDIVVNPDGDFAAYLINTENSCYNLQYPLALADINGEIVFAQDEADFNERLTSGLYFFGFPIKLTKSDGSVLNVGNGNDLFNALIACNQYIDSTFTSDAIIGCYTIVFPCNVRLINGTIKTIVNTDELNKILISNKFEDFAFPITLKDENGTDHLANDLAAFDDLLQLCDNNPIQFGSAYKLFFGIIDSTNVNGPCYTIVFPIQLELNADSTITQVQTVNNLQEMVSVIFSQGWYSANVIYPIDLILKDNTIVGIKNETELDTLIENCD